jgi:nitroreductase
MTYIFQVNKCEPVVVYVHTIRVFYPLAPEDGYSYSQAIIEFRNVLYVPIVRGFQSLWINSLDANAAILGNTLFVFSSV